MASQQQMAALLQSLLAKGLESGEALPTLKSLMEAKIFSLEELTPSNMPKSINKKIQQKILKKSRKKGQAAASGSRKKQKTAPPIVIPEVSPQYAEKEKILINRSPILTLWVTVVAKKIFAISLEEALTFGSAYAAECARAKGTSLGIYSDKPPTKDDKDYASAADKKNHTSEETDDTTTESFSLMNQTIRVNRITNLGLRAIGNTGKELDPHSIWKSLTKKLGGEDDLAFVFHRMDEAANQAGEELEATAYSYYMHVRPDIPHGTKGWGAHGYLETSKMSNFYPIDKKEAPAT